MQINFNVLVIQGRCGDGALGGVAPHHELVFDSDSLKGPVPRLFTANLEEARKNFTTNLDLAFKDLNKLTSRFFTTENLHPLNALEYLDKPKYTKFQI